MKVENIKRLALNRLEVEHEYSKEVEVGNSITRLVTLHGISTGIKRKISDYNNISVLHVD